MEDARLWAANAPVAELKARALAAFEALPPADRASFLAYVDKKEAAA